MRIIAYIITLIFFVNLPGTLKAAGKLIDKSCCAKEISHNDDKQAHKSSDNCCTDCKTQNSCLCCMILFVDEPLALSIFNAPSKAFYYSTPERETEGIFKGLFKPPMPTALF